ncbi:cobalamin B12-binding domain-containing protein [Candidatus Woesearchaeota archaeon]|nr:cobalamin B12-binding domain-containing protein [Candidatus Woesearchaeota archaeon]
MKILLLAFSVQQDVFPLGLHYLRDYAKKHHPDIDIQIKEFTFGNRVTYETNKNLEIQALAYLALEKPDVIAFSCYIWSGEMIRDFVRSIKRLHPQMKIILGGVEVSETLLTNDVEFIIKEEGEIAFKECIDYWKNLIPKNQVHNVTYLDNNQRKENPTQEIKNLDEIPFPYTTPQTKEYAVVRLETARGCLFDCHFCHYAKPTLRYFSIEYLQRHLPQLFTNYTFENLTMLDANFNSNKERMFAILDILEAQIKLHPRNLKLHCEMRPELIDQATVQQLEKYSFKIDIELGLQSTDPIVLKEINRPTHIGKVATALTLLNTSHKLTYKIDLMYGLPGDTFYKFLNSARFLLTHATKQHKLVAHHSMLLNNTILFEKKNVDRYSETHSSMIIKTPTQDIVELYKTKLFIDMLNKELEIIKN